MRSLIYENILERKEEEESRRELKSWITFLTENMKLLMLRNPALPRFLKVNSAVYKKTKLSLLKSIHSTKNLKTKLRTCPWVSRVPILNLRQISQGVP